MFKRWKLRLSINTVILDWKKMKQVQTALNLKSGIHYVRGRSLPASMDWLLFPYEGHNKHHNVCACYQQLSAIRYRYLSRLSVMTACVRYIWEKSSVLHLHRINRTGYLASNEIKLTVRDGYETGVDKRNCDLLINDISFQQPIKTKETIGQEKVGWGLMNYFVEMIASFSNKFWCSHVEKLGY